MLAEFPAKIQRQIKHRLLSLAEEPRPPGVEKMKGEIDTWRIRSGSYRIVYEIHDRVLLVLVVKIGDRKDAYRGE